MAVAPSLQGRRRPQSQRRRPWRMQRRGRDKPLAVALVAAVVALVLALALALVMVLALALAMAVRLKIWRRPQSGASPPKLPHALVLQGCSGRLLFISKVYFLSA